MKSLRYFAYVLMAAATISLVSCKKEDSYVPAEKETGLQVYFSYETPTTYELSEAGSFTIPVYRNEYSSAATVQITSTSDAPLTVPAEVSFASGQNCADLVVSYDYDALEEGKNYAASFQVANAAETTAYGISSLKVSAALPSSWFDFLGPDGEKAKVTFVQKNWGEIHTGYIHYTERADGARVCETYNEEGDISGKYEPGPGFWGMDADQHFKFIWYPQNKDANGNDLIEIQKQYYYTDSGNDLYVYDLYHYELDFDDYPASIPFTTFYEYNPTAPSSYYDGNGGFYFLVWYYVDEAFTWGAAIQGIDIEGVADGFVRTTDYNALSWKKLFKGEVESGFFDGETWDGQVMSYNETDTTLFYLPKYFTEENGLAFRDEVSAPLVFTTDDKVGDVDNDQDTGVSVFGQEVFVKVKKGTVTAVDEETGFPSFNLLLSVYTKNPGEEEGTWSEDPVSEFGNVTEILTFNSTAGYTWENLSGLEKASYTSLYYTNTAINPEDGERYEIAETYFVDDGADDTGDWIRANGFSGWPKKYWTKNDSLSIEWYSGFLYLETQSINGKFVYSGSPYNITAALFDGEYYYADGYLLGGLVEDDQVITFVDYPRNDYEVSGLVFLDIDKETSIGAFVEYVLEPAGYAAPENKGIKMKSSAGKIRTAPVHNTKSGRIVNGLDGKQFKSAKRAHPDKTFRLQPVPKAAPATEKDLNFSTVTLKKKSFRK